MPHSRSKSPGPVYFAPNLSGTLRWMGYWTLSRFVNAVQALYERWQTQLRPALVARLTALVSRGSAVLQRPGGAEAAGPYASLAAAVRERGLGDAGGLTNARG